MHINLTDNENILGVEYSCPKLEYAEIRECNFFSVVMALINELVTPYLSTIKV